MLEVFRDGGFPMWFILVFGLVALGAAVRFAVRPRPEAMAPIRALTTATLFSIGSGTAAALAAVGKKVPANPEWAHSPDLHLIVMTGIGESMAPAILGCSLLSLVWLVMAVGERRGGAALTA